MFSGIVEELGAFVGAEAATGSTRLAFSARLSGDGLAIGDSVAVNGCCLTVVGFDPGGFRADAIGETLKRTNLSDLRPGDTVNLERSLRLGERLDGHLVLGHVDGVGVVAEPAPHLRVEVPEHLARYLAEKGSVAIDGTSLTIVSAGAAAVRVELIPHTMAVTNLGARRRGERVNLEVDVLARYVERLMPGAATDPDDAASGGTR